MNRRQFLMGSAGALALAGCSKGSGSASSPTESVGAQPAGATTTTRLLPPKPGAPAEILGRSHVPVLCFHQLREFEPEDSAYARTIITPPAALRTQFEALRDGGHTPVTAAAVVNYLQFGKPLPNKPVLLSFDDGSATHHSVGVPLLTELKFPAIFFPMTVVLNKKNWLSDSQLVEIQSAGFEIGAHTWDHQRMDKIMGDQWAEEIAKPKAKLEKILGRPVDTMAYPYGLWTPEALTHVAEAGYRSAFQLADPTDPGQPLLTIRRITPPPTWEGPALLSHLERDFS